MKLRMSHITAATVVLTILWCGWLLGRPSLSLYRLTEIDINSGDFRVGMYAGMLPVSRRRIQKTPLSREVRRLGIVIPAKRAWKPAFMSIRRPSGSDILCTYSLAVSAENLLCRVLDQTGTPDEDRRIVLGKAMAALRTQGPFHAEEEAHLPADALAEKHGLEVFAPGFKEQLRQARESRNRRQPPAVP